MEFELCYSPGNESEIDWEYYVKLSMKHGSWDIVGTFGKEKNIYVYISTHVQTYASTLEKPESCSSLLIRNKRSWKKK